MKHLAALSVVMLATLLGLAAPASAHRLDEYLQATTVALSKDRVTLKIRLTPGVAVFQKVVAQIDTNGDGILSPAEQQGYAERVSHDLSLSIDGKPAPLQLVVDQFPSVAEMQQGLGDILLSFTAPLQGDAASTHRLVFDNHHQSDVGAYLVNCLVPRDPSLRVMAQDRNYNQSHYQLDFIESRSGLVAASGPAVPIRSDPISRWPLAETYFLHGVYHILTGYDHLLFVSALVQAATTLWDLVKVVTAFTLAHSLTLTLAALGLVHLSSRVVEPMISASIVFVALQNVLRPGRVGHGGRLAAAFFFGLFHGLGFAGGLLDVMREMPSGAVLLAILAFSVGVEAGHQLVVLPLFTMLKLARRTQPDAVMRSRLTVAVQRFGSVGISVAGCYYLCLALAGSS